MKYKLLKRVGEKEAGSIVELDEITPAYVNKVKLFDDSADEQESEAEGEGEKKQARGRQSSK